MKLTIRSMTKSDLEPLFGLLSDARVMRFLEPPYTREKTWEFLIKAGLSDPPLIYAVEENGRFIGYVIYHDYDEDSMEIGWVLYPAYWGKGYATHLTKLLIERAFASKKQVVLECAPDQEATKHIALKNGFSYERLIDGLDVFRLRC